ncbi:hypothetical protein FOS14_00900 [Skermania sp. ID1734]|uniref:hypothetical protein n=1 Tax=Skermania sp. ID1734 TaxID=2597516 RepID=UPI0011815113|nr:hypothetical protein [Skermania sp. ID1734]TSE01983.1 hypothetical protein FOS14_00900 [Skermania sp. ID1734]
MVIALIVLQVLTLAALVALMLYVRQIRAHTHDAAATLILEPPPPPEIAESFRAGHGRLLSVEILNPIELATSQAKFAGAVAGSLVPGLVRQIVYEQAAKILNEELPKQGVKAEVRIHAPI